MISNSSIFNRSNSILIDSLNTESKENVLTNLYQRMLKELESSENYPQTLSTFNSKEVLETLSLADRIKQPVFMSYYLSIPEYSIIQKHSLLLHLSLLAEAPLFQALEKYRMNKPTAPMEEKKVRSSFGRVIRSTQKYEDYKKNDDPVFKKQRTKLKPQRCFTPDSNKLKVEEGFASPKTRVEMLDEEVPTSDIKQAVEEVFSPTTRAKILDELVVDDSMFN